MNYVIFESNGEPTTPEQTTTSWNDSISVQISLSGQVDGSYYNLMKMDGDITSWLSENEGKVRKVTKEEINTLGRQIVPQGTTKTLEEEPGGEQITYTAGIFDIDNAENLWSEV